MLCISASHKAKQGSQLPLHLDADYSIRSWSHAQIGCVGRAMLASLVSDIYMRMCWQACWGHTLRCRDHVCSLAGVVADHCQVHAESAIVNGASKVCDLVKGAVRSWLCAQDDLQCTARSGRLSIALSSALEKLHLESSQGDESR